MTQKNKRLRTVATILAGILALLVVAALAAPMFLSDEALKAQLIAQVKKATGRTLEIKGETSVTFLPNIAVSAEDVTLSNPEGFTTPYLISLKKLATGAELRPLLRGELIINGITLDGATINLEEVRSGARNWEFTAEKVKDSAEEASDAPEAQKNSRSTIKRFALGDIDITDSAINIIKPNAEVIALSNIDVTLKGADANSPLSLEGSADYRGEQVSLALDIARTRDFLDDKTSPMTVALKLPGGSLDFNGNARMGEQLAAQGKLDATTSSLPKVIAWATGKAPSGNLPKQVMLGGNATYAGTTLALSGATLRLDETKAEGTLGIDHGGAIPKIKGNLAFGALDLEEFTGKSSGGSNSGSSGGSGSSGWSSDTVDLSALRSFNADLGLAWEKLTSGKLTLGPSRAHAAINGGKLALTLKSVQLYGGSASGVVRTSPGGIGADIKASGIDIEALMNALADKSRLEGRTTLVLNVNASGSSQAAWVRSLNGKGAIKVNNGALKGINIGRFLRDLKSSGLLFRSEAESTDFTELGGTFTISKGVLSNSDLAMKSPALRLAGSGSANLPAKTINYRLLPTISETTKGQGGKDDVDRVLTIPLVITGPWSNPSVTPDLAGMVQEGLKDPEAFKQNIESLKDTWGDINSTGDLKRLLLGGGKATETPAPAATETKAAPAPATKAETAPTETKAAPEPTKAEPAPPETKAEPAPAETKAEPAPAETKAEPVEPKAEPAAATEPAASDTEQPTTK